MSFFRATFAIFASTVTLRAARQESSCPPNFDCAPDAGSCVNLLQTRFVRDRREATIVQPGVEGAATLAKADTAGAATRAAEADPVGTSGKLRGAQQKPEPAPESLAAVSARVSLKQHKNGPKDAGWFQGFSEGESTYDTDGELKSSGWDSNSWVPAEDIAAYLPLKPTPKPDKFFQETESGGPTEAWQTFYPAVPDTKPRGSPNMGWKSTVYHGFQQHSATYKAEDQIRHWSQAKGAKGPMWFDTAVGEYDAFGRARAPSAHSQRRYIEWDQRTKRINLTCGSIGCVANATFPQLFNHTEEQRRLCLLNIGVHATDFDDEYSRERVEFFKANGNTVGVNCDPMAQGNTVEAQKPLYPCVTDLNIDKLIKDDGSLFLEGKVNELVDEFPRNGNLLDAEATVTCLVRKRPSWHPAEPVPVDRVFNKTLAELFKGQSVSKQFGCTQPGCVAETLLELEESPLNRTCKLTVKIVQTDFDGSLGTDEQVEFLKVNGRTLKQGVKPGKNPCKRAAELGQQPPSTSQLHSLNLSNLTNETNLSGMSEDPDIFVLVDSEDISEDAKSGKIRVASKISDMVDECGYSGLLLSGIAIVNCEVDEQEQKIISGVVEGVSTNTTSGGSSTAASSASTNASMNSTANANANASLNSSANTSEAGSASGNATASGAAGSAANTSEAGNATGGAGATENGSEDGTVNASGTGSVAGNATASGGAGGAANTSDATSAAGNATENSSMGAAVNASGTGSAAGNATGADAASSAASSSGEGSAEGKATENGTATSAANASGSESTSGSAAENGTVNGTVNGNANASGEASASGNATESS